MKSNRLGVALWGCVSSWLWTSCFAQPASKPNIVFILMDDLGIRDLNSTGSTFYRTPNMDRIGEEGMRFTQAYTPGSICSPSRVGMIFGRYPARLRVTDWIPGREVPYGKVITPQHNYFVRLGTSSMASELKAAGYATALIGKSHISLQSDKVHTPAAYGFDHVYENWALNRASTPEDPKGVARLTEEAIQFMREHRDRPFLVFLSHYSVHDPVQFCPRVMEEYRERVDPDDPQNCPEYAAMLDAADQSVGTLLDAIRDLGLEENTAVFFMSDNGGLLTNTSNKPFRSGKGSLYEGGIRTPFFVRWPARIKRGSVSDEVVLGIDLMPTFMEMAGVATKGAGLDGVSLLPSFSGNPLGRDAVYWHYPHYYYPQYPPCGAIRMGRYKLLHFYDTNRFELYDLEKDPGEQDDLALRMPERVDAMQARLSEWRRSIGAQEVRANPDHDPERASIWRRKQY